jgi:GT2 family glycosyltransferase
MPALAALLTVHNRCNLTLNCLDTIFAQTLPDDFALQVYLVDDGSTDGTAGQIRRRFPQVHVIPGDGLLYWGGGMRLAWDNASRGDYDYYLWLNDDTKLFPGAIQVLLATAADLRERHGRDPIVVGSTHDEHTGVLTYGGKWLRHQVLIAPGAVPKPCDTMNGNIVLIPRAVFAEVGNVSREFTHVLGDQDYSLRAAAMGIPVYIAPGYLGMCSVGPLSSWARRETPLRKRWQVLHTPKGVPPKEYSEFLRRHAPSKRLWRLLKLYGRVAFPSIWGRKTV